MFSEYLKQALATLTEGLDSWEAAKVVCEGLDRAETDKPLIWVGSIAALSMLFADRVRWLRMWDALAGSHSMRKFFKNAAKDSREKPILAAYWPPNPQAYPPKQMRLLSLLRAMLEAEATTTLPSVGSYWVGELMDALKDGPGGQWQTNFATQMVEEAYDAATCFAIFRRIWETRLNSRSYPIEDWDQCKQYSARLQRLDGEGILDIVSRHIVPRPDQRFDYVGPTSSPFL